jgi:hypothetical protein
MILALLIQTASAMDMKWWGAGPTLGTMVFPSQYPISFPAGAREGKTTSGDPLVDKVGFDLEIGARGVLYPTAAGRLGARVVFGFGGGVFGRQQFTLEYEAALVKQGSFQVLAGAGIGVGHERFRDADGNDYLDVSYYPIRGELAGLLRDGTRAYELALWGQYHITGNQKYYASSNDASPIDGKGDSLVSGALYFAIGIESTVFFGDFKTDKKKKSSGSGSSKKKKSGGSGGGSSFNN